MRNRWLALPGLAATALMTAACESSFSGTAAQPPSGVAATG